MTDASLNADEKLIEFGKSVKLHGLKGDFHFQLHNTHDSILRDGLRVFLKPLSQESSLPPEGAFFVLKKISFAHKVIVLLEGVEDLDAAEALLPFSIFVPRKDFPALPAGQYYLVDVVGLDACDYQTEQIIGRVVDFYENAAQIILQLKINGNTEIVDLPWVDDFFPEIQLENKRVMVRMPTWIEVR